MSVFSLDSIVGQRDDDDSDHAVEVGATPPFKHPQTVMRVGKDGGNLVYVEEIEVTCAVTEYVEEYALDLRARWRRIECRVRRNETSICRDEWFVMAQLPYSTAIVSIAQFKPPWKKRVPDKPKPSKRFLSAEEFIEWTEAQTFDYWETGNYLTAGISLPDELNIRDPDARRIFNQPSTHGVCRNLKEYFHLLRFSEESQQLLKQTYDRTIPFWSLSAKLGDLPYLRDNTIEKADKLLDRSIYQALAGPPKDSDKWFGRLVMDFVSELYKDHLNDINRRKY